MRPLPLTIDGKRFCDAHGRSVLLRGVNLGGDCKVPYSPDGRTHLATDFSDHHMVSFVGRPFPLAEAAEHFARLEGWGFNCLRLLTTWEAVEHAGPGQYDQEYLAYLRAIVEQAGDHGFYVFIDFHQDVWSRMTGGDGAPGWTLEAAGLDFTRFHAAGAAHVMQYEYDPAIGGRQEDRYPMMSWSQNYQMPANAIMWTLFFAGNQIVPDFKVGGIGAQDYLQQHYLGAMRAVAEVLADQPHVIGFDTLNEPGTGWIGHGLTAPLPSRRGLLWSTLSALSVAAGIPTSIGCSGDGNGPAPTKLVNPDGVSIWQDGARDPFRDAGIWDIVDGAAFALQPDAFRRCATGTLEVERDCMLPFFHRIANTIRAIRDDWFIFAEVNPFDAFKGARFPEGMPERSVNASHWYDLTTLVTKRFGVGERDLMTGEARDSDEMIAARYVDELTRMKALGDELGSGAPTLIGEFGIPFDLNDADAYRAFANGDQSDAPWALHIRALSLMYDAMDALQLHSTQWNYTASNRNDAAIGDGWNQEDLSIYSADQADPSKRASGGRAVRGFSRPYVRACQGEVVNASFDQWTRRFDASIMVDPDIEAPTQIFVPHAQYPRDIVIRTSDPNAVCTHDDQTLSITATNPGIMQVMIESKDR